MEVYPPTYDLARMQAERIVEGQYENEFYKRLVHEQRLHQGGYGAYHQEYQGGFHPAVTAAIPLGIEYIAKPIGNYAIDKAKQKVVEKATEQGESYLTSAYNYLFPPTESAKEVEKKADQEINKLTGKETESLSPKKLSEVESTKQKVENKEVEDLKKAQGVREQKSNIIFVPSRVSKQLPQAKDTFEEFFRKYKRRHKHQSPGDQLRYAKRDYQIYYYAH